MKGYSQYIFILTVILFVGCQNKSSQNPKDYSDSLIIYPDATNVFHAKVNQTEQVTYNLKVSYPASEVINVISKNIEGNGWVPLKESFLNLGIPTSFVRGWTIFEDGAKQPNVVVHSWHSDWKNKNEDIPEYILSYSYPVNTQPDLSSLSVVAIFIPSDTATAMEKASLEILRQYKRHKLVGQ